MRWIEFETSVADAETADLIPRTTATLYLYLSDGRVISTRGKHSSVTRIPSSLERGQADRIGQGAARKPRQYQETIPSEAGRKSRTSPHWIDGLRQRHRVWMLMQ